MSAVAPAGVEYHTRPGHPTRKARVVRRISTSHLVKGPHHPTPLRVSSSEPHEPTPFYPCKETTLPSGPLRGLQSTAHVTANAGPAASTGATTAIRLEIVSLS